MFVFTGKNFIKPNNKIRISVVNTDNGAGILRNHLAFLGVISGDLLFLSTCKAVKIPVNWGMKYNKLKARENNIFARKDSPKREKDNIVLPFPRNNNVKKEIRIYVGKVAFKVIFNFCKNKFMKGRIKRKYINLI